MTLSLLVFQGEDNIEYFLGLTPSGIIVLRNRGKVGNYFWWVREWVHWAEQFALWEREFSFRAKKTREKFIFLPRGCRFGRHTHVHTYARTCSWLKNWFHTEIVLDVAGEWNCWKVAWEEILRNSVNLEEAPFKSHDQYFNLFSVVETNWSVFLWIWFFT